MINGEKFFHQPIEDNKVTYENIRKVATGKEMIAQVVVCWIIHALGIAIKQLQ